MKVSQALLQRRSTRAFQTRPVERTKIEQILEHAKWAPSGVNLQPWRIYVVTGTAKQRLSKQLLAEFASGRKAQMDYQYYPLVWKPIFKQRRDALAQAMFGLLKIKRDDQGARFSQWSRNYLAFDAPCMLLFSIDESLQTGSYLDYGMFLQSIMLMAEELGLATCVQASLAEYPNILREFIGAENAPHFVCGMALGYAAQEAEINQLRPSRLSLSDLATFIEI
ncbi:MAG: nitroreductase [Thiotrichales bacterium]|nr:nitroreductase [Thiotrichales bacterium]